ncbi:MAG: hypothetical protein IJA67_13785 [Oscillospiraceae bacterium]|nr:hypothetical protein [Oscillospiraceae bacterium]
MRKSTIISLVILALVLCTQLGNVRDLLNSRSMDCEEMIYNALWEERDSLSLMGYGLTPHELNAHWSHVIHDHGELFYVADRYEYKSIGDLVLSVHPIYAVSGDERELAQQLYSDTIQDILDAVQPTWTDLQTALYLHDYLCSHYAYDESLQRYSAYELLTEGKGVCQAYTLVYDALLTACGIESSYVISREMNHSWNVVTIDGKRYNVDVTYDDPSPDHLGKAFHTHFLCSDAKLAEDHSFTPEEGFGQCTDSFYDSGALWETVSTAFVPIGDRFYYIKSGMLYQWDGSRSEYIDTIYATWFTDRGDQSYWRGNYSALLAHEGKLLYSKPDCIMAYDPADGSFEVFYKHTYGPDIYGFQIKDDQLLLQVSASPNEAGQVISVTLPQ